MVELIPLPEICSAPRANFDLPSRGGWNSYIAFIVNNS